MESERFGADSLTAPEATLLDYLQRGAPDAEVAVRLGLPIGEAKARIAALLNRLQLSSRTALADWDGRVIETIESAPDGAVSVASGEPEAPQQFASPRRSYARLTPLAVVVAVLVAVAAYIGTAQEGGKTTLVPSAALRTIDQLGAPAAYVDGVPLPELRIGTTTTLPNDLALIQWHTGTGVVRRLYGGQDGLVRSEELFAPAGDETVAQVAATADGREIVVAVHTLRSGGLPPVITVSRSHDGGASWVVVGATGEDGFVTALGPANVAIALDAADGSRRVELLPGRITVRNSAQLLDANVPWKVIGTAIQEDPATAFRRYTSVTAFPYGERYAVRVRGAGAVGVGVADDQGTLVSGFTANVRAVVNVVPGGLIAADLAIPSTRSEDDRDDLVLALIDPTTGVAHPIDTGAGSSARREQALTVAVQRGPLVHLGGADGGCTPVRNRPVIDGEVLYCAPEGMALRSGETRVHNDYTWVRVMSGRERPGWVDLSYVWP